MSQTASTPTPVRLLALPLPFLLLHRAGTADVEAATVTEAGVGAGMRSG